MNSMTVFNPAQLPAAFRQGPVAGMGDLTEGVSQGFPVVSFKGKVWRVKVRGEVELWLDDRGQPVPYVDAVIINGSSHVSKQFYAKKFAEGEDAGAPDCWSMNGVRPDKSVAEPVHPSCASCPKNQWGSRMSESGKQAKACQDNRRLAVVPHATLLDKNEAWGGAMLLRIPPTSLQELAGFQKKMKQLGFPYYAVAVRIHFDLNKAHPVLMFTPLQPLNDAEAAVVIEMATSEATQRMLNEAVDFDVDAEAAEEAIAKVESAFLNGTKGVTPPAAEPTSAVKVTAAVAQAEQPAPLVPVTPANDANPLVAQLRPLVISGVMTKEAFKAATGLDFDPPAPVVEEKAPWAPKPEHIALADLVAAGSLGADIFKNVSGYDYEGPLPKAAAPAAPVTPAATPEKKTRSKKDAAAQQDIIDAEYKEKPAMEGLDKALDSILGG